MLLVHWPQQNTEYKQLLTIPGASIWCITIYTISTIIFYDTGMPQYDIILVNSYAMILWCTNQGRNKTFLYSGPIYIPNLK